MWFHGLRQRIGRKARIDLTSPRILKGKAAEWPACRRWSPDYFASEFGDVRVDVTVCDSGIVRWSPDGKAENPQQQSYLEGVALREAVSWIVNSKPSGPKYYVCQHSIPRLFPGLLSDLDLSGHFGEGTVNLWFGSKDNHTPLHHDGSDNTFVQIFGRKTFTLFSPEQTDMLYPNPAGTKMAHLSQIDLARPDYEAFPRFRQARPLVYKLGPGDILTFPRNWWHYVVSDTISISVNHWTP